MKYKTNKKYKKKYHMSLNMNTEDAYQQERVYAH